MKNKYFYTFIFLIALLLSSCAVKIKNFERYSTVNVSTAPLAPPTSQIKTSQIKVALYPLEDKSNNKSKATKNSSLSNISTSLVRGILTQTNVAVIDRNALDKLSDEAVLKATESNKEVEFSAANFAIKGQIDSANSYSSFRDAYTEEFTEQVGEDAKGNPIYKKIKTLHPATCSYTGEVSGRVEVYSLPSLEIALEIQLRGKSTKSVEAAGTALGGLTSLTDNDLLKAGIWLFSTSKLAKQCQNKNIAASSLNDAVQNSVSKNKRKKILNQFAAKGYVSDIRFYKNKYIIETTLGSKNGLRQNNTLYVYRQEKAVNRLSGEEKIENKKIAEARVSQLVEAENAWLVVKKRKEAEKILIGDFIKAIY